MFLFLALALLLIHRCSGQDLSNAKDVTAEALYYINFVRFFTATGVQYKMGGYLPGSQSMFKLEPSAVLNSTAQKNILNCTASSENIPAGQSINFYTLTYPTQQSLNSTTFVYVAISQWAQEPILYGIDDNVMYTNPELKEFANMVYYKSTEAACYYNLCYPTPATPTQAVACVFNMSPQKNQPLYIPSEGVTGCQSNDTCSEQLPESTCITDANDYIDPGLCVAGNKTFTAATSADPTTLGTPLNMTDAIREQILNMHNYRRSRLAQGLVPNGTTGKKLPAGMDIAKLNYNMTLENAAQAYANSCPTGLSSVASRNDTGEIYQSLPSNALAYKDVISMALKASWHAIYTTGFNEQLDFGQLLEAIPNAPLMFTQMAWGDTYSVGCGAARCSDNTTVICRYYPRGNLVGQKLYTAGTTCSMCPNDCTTANTFKGLCIIK